MISRILLRTSKAFSLPKEVRLIGVIVQHSLYFP
jgi:hypothetical protein